MKKRYIPLKIAGTLLAMAALYVFSYAPVMAFVFWGFNTGHVSSAALARANAFYAPIVRYGPPPEFGDPYSGFWLNMAMRVFR